jgi:transposase
VFLDESGVNTGMTRRYGRAKGKKRVCDSTPFNHKKNTTLIAAIRLGGKPVTGKIEGSMRGSTFLEYLTQTLVPVLNKGDVVIMDNLQTHKVKGVEEAVRRADASILYLPPYSPDLNPIEEMWSKVKSYLRKIKARTLDILLPSVDNAYSTVTDTDLLGWFSHAGYRVS